MSLKSYQKTICLLRYFCLYRSNDHFFQLLGFLRIILGKHKIRELLLHRYVLSSHVAAQALGSFTQSTPPPPHPKIHCIQLCFSNVL